MVGCYCVNIVPPGDCCWMNCGCRLDVKLMLKFGPKPPNMLARFDS